MTNQDRNLTLQLEHNGETLTGSAEAIARRILGGGYVHRALLQDTIREVEYHAEPVAEPVKRTSLRLGGELVYVLDGRPVTRKGDLRRAELLEVSGFGRGRTAFEPAGRGRHKLTSYRVLRTIDGQDLEELREGAAFYVDANGLV